MSERVLPLASRCERILKSRAKLMPGKETNRKPIEPIKKNQVPSLSEKGPLAVEKTGANIYPGKIMLPRQKPSGISTD